MEFSQSVSLFFDAPTMSGMKDGHLCGQSCNPHTHAAFHHRQGRGVVCPHPAKNTRMQVSGHRQGVPCSAHMGTEVMRHACMPLQAGTGIRATACLCERFCRAGRRCCNGGRTCFRIWTKIMFILFRKVRSRRKLASSVLSLMIRLLMYVLMPSRCSSGSAPHRYLITSSMICASGLTFWTKKQTATMHGN